MTILDRYLLREWFKVFWTTALGFPVVVILFDLTDNLDKYLSRGLGKGAVLLGYAFHLPETVYQVLPAAVLFATVFTVGALGRHSELTAAKASGISFHRLIRPLVAAAGGAFLFGLLLAEVAPVATSRRMEILGDKAIRATSTRYNFVYLAKEGWVYAVRSLDLGTRTMRDLILSRAGAGADYPTIVLVSPTARFADTTGRWTLGPGAVRFLAHGEKELAFAYDSMRLRALRETPVDLLAEPKAPEEMRYGELGRYIDALARSGTDHKKLRVRQALKIAVPFTCVIIALFGAPLAISTPRQGGALGVGISLATTVVFLILIQLSQAVGAGGLLPPVVAAWVPNGIFAVMAVVLLRKART